MKKQITNRILSIVLVLVVVLGMLPKISFTASAAESEYDGVIGELYYKVDKENNVTTIFGNGALSSTTALVNVMTSNVVIEEGVTSIGNYAFRGLSSLEKLTVKGDVTIGNYAFQGCASLETITFMGDVTSVGRNAFQGCAGLSTIYYYGTTEPSYTNDLSYITLYSSGGVSFCGLTPSNLPVTEATELFPITLIKYADGSTQYFKYNNYLYKATYTNLIIENVSVGEGSGASQGNLVLFSNSYSYVPLRINSNTGNRTALSDLPTSPGGSLTCYISSVLTDYAKDTSKPVVTITCIAVKEPTWSWTDTSSATATFTAKDANVFATAKASISSKTVSEAVNCQTKEQIQYTATVTFNGQKYTNTKTVHGDVGTHSYTYTANGFVLTETCANNCGHQAIADIVAGEAIYTGSAITNTATISYTAGTWAGDKPVLSFENNVNVGTATAKMTAGGATASTTFKINPTNISYTTVIFDPEKGTYNGNAHTPSITVTFNGATLVKDTDYTLSWDKSDITNADTYTATITGKGNFKGTKDAVFSIDPADIKGAVVTIDQNTFVYDGQPHKPTAIVTFNGAVLTEGVDYELYYVSKDQIIEWDNGEPLKFIGNQSSDSINVGQYYAVALGKGNYAANSRFTYAAYTIKQVKNAWVTEPSISGWTYGEAANAPTAEAKFGTVYVLYDGTANDGTTYDGDTPPTKAGSYVARFYVDGTTNYEPIGDGVPFTITKANQAAPTGIGKEDETISKKEDGKITGVDSMMEYRKDGEDTYTAITGETIENLAAGKYYVRFKGDSNHNASADTAVTIATGRKLTVKVPQNQVGYTMTTTTPEVDWFGSIRVEFKLHEGYSMTDDFQIYNGTEPMWRHFNQQTGVLQLNFVGNDFDFTVNGVGDITPPIAEITVDTNKWDSFLNTITFGLFFNEAQNVTITAADGESGVNTIQYHLECNELTKTEVEQITEWVDYNGTFKIEPNNHYVVYAKVTDNAGNISYINSDGVVLDNIAPTLEGIENGKTYYGDLTVIKSDEQFYDIKMVTLNGEEMGFAEGTYGLIPADNAEHIVVVEDHAGNKTTYTVTVYKNYTVTFKADGNTVDTQTVGHGKDATLPNIPTKDGFAGKWGADGKNIIENTTISVIYTALSVVDSNKVKPEDKTDLEGTKAKLEEMLDDGYTEGEKKKIQDTIDNIDDALKVIGNVESVEELIEKLPDIITKNDEDAINAADKAYNALTEYEKSLVDEKTKNSLKNAKEDIEKLNENETVSNNTGKGETDTSKPTTKPDSKPEKEPDSKPESNPEKEPESPNTGDSANLHAWLAVVFASGAIIFASGKKLKKLSK